MSMALCEGSLEEGLQRDLVREVLALNQRWQN